MTTTIWSLDVARRKHRHSPLLAESLLDVLPPEEPVLDLGCGVGFYLAFLSQHGYRCLGIEGTPDILEIAEFANIQKADLATPLTIDWPRSSVLCLEVAEHLLPEQENQLLTTIDAYCSRCLVLSWAIPGQQGHGHRNCRTNEYVAEQMRVFHFERSAVETERLRRRIDRPTRYFRNTLQVFRR